MSVLVGPCKRRWGVPQAVEHGGHKSIALHGGKGAVCSGKVPEPTDGSR